MNVLLLRALNTPEAKHKNNRAGQDMCFICRITQYHTKRYGKYNSHADRGWQLLKVENYTLLNRESFRLLVYLGSSVTASSSIIYGCLQHYSHNINFSQHPKSQLICKVNLNLLAEQAAIFVLSLGWHSHISQLIVIIKCTKGKQVDRN